MDGSSEAKHALEWVLQRVFRPDADYLDIVSVATLTEPFVRCIAWLLVLSSAAQHCVLKMSRSCAYLALPKLLCRLLLLTVS